MPPTSSSLKIRAGQPRRPGARRSAELLGFADLLVGLPHSRLLADVTGVLGGQLSDR
jgi:hypothetical protein